MSCYLFAMKNFNSSFFEIDAMNLDLLLDLINVEEKITSDIKSDKNLFFALQKVFYSTFRVTKSIIEKILKNRERWRKI